MASFLIVFAAYVAGMCWFLGEVRKPDYKKTYLKKKTMQSAAFLAVLLLAFLKSGRSDVFWIVLPAFFCCFAGDVLLALYNTHRKKRVFAMGLFLFLAGHLFFLHWMVRMRPFCMEDLLFPAAGVVLVAFLTGSKSFHTGRLRPCILLYSFFVAALFSKSIHIAWSTPDAFHLLMAVGGTLFLISDFSILFLYFYKTKDVRIHLFNLLTYYLGMFFLASCMWFA